MKIPEAASAWIQYYDLQVWSKPFKRWRTLAHGQLKEMKIQEDDLIQNNILHNTANTRIIRATGNKETHFGEGNYEYDLQ